MTKSNRKPTTDENRCIWPEGCEHVGRPMLCREHRVDPEWLWYPEPGPLDTWCWIAPGCRTAAGYALVSVNGRRSLAHRYAWERSYGPIPPGLFVCHRCDNPPCCNFKHLFLGTQGDNLADMRAKGRQVYGAAHGRAKLTAAGVVAIRAAYAQGGVRQKDLAATYGVTAGTISKATRRDTWSRIE